MPKSGFDWARWARWTTAIPDRRDDLLAVLNGAVGDALFAEDSPHALPMDLRLDGAPLDLSDALSVRDASEHIALFTHGLMATDRFWGQVGSPGFDARLKADLGVTPVCVRYNTGRHISLNGEQLAELLGKLVAAWPVPVKRLTLIGHSMGGLVTRSALHYGAEQDWVRLVDRVILLGVPQRGAPLEQVAHIAAFTLKAIPNPWTWGISWLLRQRSDGIRDLRHGYLVHDEWQERAAESLTIARRYALPLADGIPHFVAAGALASTEHHVVSKLIGDAMVTPFSAKDEGLTGKPTPRTPTESRVFPGISHVTIAGHDTVYDQLLAWCQTEY